MARVEGSPAHPSLAAQAGRFEHVQKDLFGAGGAFVNAWADYDLDGDLDLALTVVDAGSGYNGQNDIPLHFAVREITHVYVQARVRRPGRELVATSLAIDLDAGATAFTRSGSPLRGGRVKRIRVSDPW